MNKEKKVQYIVIAVLGVAVTASLLFMLRPASGERLVAKIQVDSKEVATIDLDTAANEVFSIEQSTGLPIEFEIKDHAIRFLHSDCPDKVCVNSGYQSRDMDIASCLPNRTVLSVQSR